MMRTFKSFIENNAGPVFNFEIEPDQHVTLVTGDKAYYYFDEKSFVIKMKDDAGAFLAIKGFLADQELAEAHYNALLGSPKFGHTSILQPIQFCKKVDFSFNIESGMMYFQIPIIVMPWVDGESLRTTVEDLCKRNDLPKLANLYDKLKQFISHKYKLDLVHGNLSDKSIFIKADGSMMLLDYDNFHRPQVEPQQAISDKALGFTHPYARDIIIHKNSDDFPTLILATTLYSLSIKPALLNKYQSKEGLLFSRETIDNWGHSALKKDLELIKDPYLDNLIMGISISLNKQNAKIEDLHEYIFDNNPASPARKIKLQNAYLRSCPERKTVELTDEPTVFKTFPRAKGRFPQPLAKNRNAEQKTKDGKPNSVSRRKNIPIALALGLMSVFAVYFLFFHSNAHTQVLTQKETKENESISNHADNSFIDSKNDSVELLRSTTPIQEPNDRLPKISAQEAAPTLDPGSEETNNYQKPDPISKFSATANYTKTEATEPSLSPRKSYRKRSSIQKDISFKPLD
ncbi:MAG: hypothetical protein JST58_12140 [Bacteroidetes bacterium]|nr:hypothetical protein [Bacteroidota bacterium]